MADFNHEFNSINTLKVIIELRQMNLLDSFTMALIFYYASIIKNSKHRKGIRFNKT